MTRTAASPGAYVAQEAILRTAERLFAEHGLAAISNRQVSRAARQRNNAAVWYHFGTRADLVRAIVDRHDARMEERRAWFLAACDGSREVRHWVSCLVRPTTDYLGTLEQPTGYARFCAQVVTDPALRDIWWEVTLSSPTMRQIREGLETWMPGLPEPVRRMRYDMGLQLVVQVCAEFELALATSNAALYDTWRDCGTAIIDAIVGMWDGPTTY